MDNQSSVPTMNKNFKLCNIVYSMKLEPAVNIWTLETLLPNVKICGRRSSICLKRKYSYLVNKCGRVLIFKCKNDDDAKDAVAKLLAELRNSCLDFNVLIPPIVCNVVGTVYLGFNVNLGLLSQQIPSEYEPDHHVSLFAKLGRMRATVTHTGKAILFGARSISEFEQAANDFIEMGCKYLKVVQNVSGRTA